MLPESLPDQHERKIRIISGSHPFAPSLNSGQVNRELFSNSLVFLDDLLCQIVLISDFIDLMKLSLNPIYMLFLIHNNVL